MDDQYIYMLYSEQISSILKSEGLTDAEIYRCFFFIQNVGRQISQHSKINRFYRKNKPRSTNSGLDGYQRNSVEYKLTYSELHNRTTHAIFAKNVKYCMKILEKHNLIHCNNSFHKAESENEKSWAKSYTLGSKFITDKIDDLKIIKMLYENKATPGRGSINRMMSGIIKYVNDIILHMKDKIKVNVNNIPKSYLQVLNSYKHIEFDIKDVNKVLNDNVDISNFKNVENICNFLAILNGMDYATIDNSGRLHYPFTIINENIRKLITFDGEDTNTVDIKCSQPSLLTIVLDQLVKIKPDCIDKNEYKNYKNACKSLDFDIYNFIADKNGLKTRREAKPVLLSVLFGSLSNNNSNKAEMLASTFPSIFKMIQKIKLVLAEKSIENNNFSFIDDIVKNLKNKKNDNILISITNISDRTLERRLENKGFNYKTSYSEVSQMKVDSKSEYLVDKDVQSVSSKVLAYLLQSLESTIVFSVIDSILVEIGDISLLTVHDSITSKTKYMTQITTIFKRVSKELFNFEPILL